MALQMREGAPARQPELKLNRQLSRVTVHSDVRRRPKFGWGVVRRSGEPAGRVSAIAPVGFVDAAFGRGIGRLAFGNSAVDRGVGRVKRCLLRIQFGLRRRIFALK